MTIMQEQLPAASEAPAAETIAQPESAGRLILVAIGWFVLAGLIGGLPFGIVVGVLEEAYGQNISLTGPLGFTVIALVSGCIMLVAVRRRSAVVGHGNRRAGVGDEPIKRWWLVLVLAFLATTWAFLTTAYWNALLPNWAASWRSESRWILVGFIVATVVIAPFSEELFYRGWLWTGLRRHWRAFPTVLLTCSLWLISHIDRGVLVLILLIPTAVILGLGRQFCGIRAALALHTIYNSTIALFLVILVISKP